MLLAKHFKNVNKNVQKFLNVNINVYKNSAIKNISALKNQIVSFHVDIQFLYNAKKI